MPSLYTPEPSPHFPVGVLFPPAKQAAGLAPREPAPAPAAMSEKPAKLPVVGSAQKPDFQALEARLERVEAMLSELLTLMKGKKK